MTELELAAAAKGLTADQKEALLDLLPNGRTGVKRGYGRLRSDLLKAMPALVSVQWGGDSSRFYRTPLGVAVAAALRARTTGKES